MKRAPLIAAATLLLAGFASTPGLAAATPSLNALTKASQPPLEQFEPGLRERLSKAREAAENAGESTGRDAARAWGQLGMLYHAHDIRDAARACYQNALRAAPDAFSWLYLLAYLEQDAGHNREAIAGYRKALAVQPDYLAAQLRLAGLLLSENANSEAEKIFGAVLDKHPASAIALAGLAEIAMAERRYDQAVELFRRALTLEPEASQINYRLALAYRAMDKLELAKQYLEKKGPRLPAISDPLLAEVSKLRSTSQLHIRKGVAAYEAGDYAAAAKHYRAALEEDPDDARTLAALSWVLELDARHLEAMQVVQTALRIDPALGAANYQMGALLEQAGNDAAAIEHYRKAVIAEPDAIPPRVLLANALLRGRQFRQAAAHYERLLKALPDDVLVRYRAGLANLGAGKCDAAIQHLRHAFENLTGNATLLEAMVRAVATCPSSSPADRQAALVYGQKLFDKLQRPDTGATLAMTLAALKRFPEAIALQKKVLQAAQGAKLPAAIMHAFEKNLALYEANQAAASAFETDEPVFNVPRVDSRQRLAMARGKPATQ